MENNSAPQQGEGKDPSGFLGEILNSAVTVKLNSGVVYKGILYILHLATLPSSYLAILIPPSLPNPHTTPHQHRHEQTS